MKLGYLGPRTNSEIAANMLDWTFMSVRFNSMQQVVNALDTGKIDRAIIPVKNSITGDILNYSGMIEEYGFKIVQEISVPIRHCLGSVSRDVGFVVSHEQALKQCAQYLDKKFPWIYKGSMDSTALAAKFIAGTRGNGAAIASLETCTYFGLKILEKDIVKNNISIFYVCKK